MPLCEPNLLSRPPLLPPAASMKGRRVALSGVAHRPVASVIEPELPTRHRASDLFISGEELMASLNFTESEIADANAWFDQVKNEMVDGALNAPLDGP